MSSGQDKENDLTFNEVQRVSSHYLDPDSNNGSSGSSSRAQFWNVWNQIMTYIIQFQTPIMEAPDLDPHINNENRSRSIHQEWKLRIQIRTAIGTSNYNVFLLSFLKSQMEQIKEMTHVIKDMRKQTPNTVELV